MVRQSHYHYRATIVWPQKKIKKILLKLLMILF